MSWVPRESKNMSKNINRASGTLIHIGDEWLEDESIVYTVYDEDSIETLILEGLSQLKLGSLDLKRRVGWVDIVGLHNVELFKEIGRELKLHSLLLEDVLNTTQRSKVKDYGDHIFIIVKSAYMTEENTIETEQVSFILFEDKLISIREFKSDIFNATIDRLNKGSTSRKKGADYLLHSLLDEIIDNHLVVMEYLGDRIDTTEEALLESPRKQILNQIYDLKRELIYISSFVWPMKSVVSNLSKYDHKVLDEKTYPYIRRLSEDLSQISDMISTYRDICSNMLDTYMSSIGNKTNDVMKVLTIFSTIFIPLTFIAGVYGMNFEYIPELDWRYSYAIFWAVSVIITIVMIRFFKRRDWL